MAEYRCTVCKQFTTRSYIREAAFCQKTVDGEKCKGLMKVVRTTLDEDLVELERLDPNVAKAREKLDETFARLSGRETQFLSEVQLNHLSEQDEVLIQLEGRSLTLTCPAVVLTTTPYLTFRRTMKHGETQDVSILEGWKVLNPAWLTKWAYENGFLRDEEEDGGREDAETV